MWTMTLRRFFDSLGRGGLLTHTCTQRLPDFPMMAERILFAYRPGASAIGLCGHD